MFIYFTSVNVNTKYEEKCVPDSYTKYFDFQNNFFDWFKFQQTLLVYCLISKTHTLRQFTICICMKKVKWHILKKKKVRLVSNSLIDLGLLVGHKGHYTLCLQVSLSFFTGAYLVPYFILLILIGIPLFFLELAVGQRIRRGSIGVWNYVCPKLGGIGVSSLMVSQ